MEVLNTGEWQREDRGKLTRTQKESTAGRNVHIRNWRKEGRKKVSCKLTSSPSWERKKLTVYPTSNFQIFSYAFPSIYLVFLGLKVEHFCSDFRYFLLYCLFYSENNREHAVTWHSELPSLMLSAVSGIMYIVFILLTKFSKEMGLTVIMFSLCVCVCLSIFSPGCFLLKWLNFISR